VIERPSPLSRSIEMPGRRWIDSARFASGKSAMSSAVIASMIWFERRFWLSAFWREARKPVTTIASPPSASPGCGVASPVAAPPEETVSGAGRSCAGGCAAGDAAGAAGAGVARRKHC
jgi:hypothetical protein